jgi:hypothetical protein
LGARAAKLQSAGYGGLGVPLTGQNARPGGGAPRELARSGRGTLTPNRRPSSSRASTKEQGEYGHDTYTHPSRGVVRGGAKDPTDDPAELDVLF